MCGFVGRVLKSNNSVSHDTIEAALKTIAHRGPDDRGIYTTKNIGLGHNRLAIIDIAHGHQPMSYNGDRNVKIVYNGEVYNFSDLRRKVISKGEKLSTYTDTEVILSLYIAFGVESFGMLNGMYSFCIYDEDKDEIILCRDRFGIKPLYYMDTSEAFSFASEVKTLKVFDDYKFTVNLNSISEYLTFQFYISDETPYKNINTLPSGSYMIYKNGIQEITKYYFPKTRINYDISYDEAKQKISSLLEDSININTVSDTPIGTYLSGGVDSSIISSVIGISHNDIKHSFSGAFEPLAYDETAYAKDVANKYELDHKIIYPNMTDFINTIKDISHAMDYPESGPGVFPQYMVSKLASEHVKVVLGGQGGDEIFGGYARYFIAYLEQSLHGAIFETQDKHKHITVLNELINNLPILKTYVPMLQNFWKENLFESKEQRYFDLINRLKDVNHLFSEDFLETIEQYNNFEKFKTSFGSEDESYFNRMTMFDLNYSMQGLLHVEDRMSMIHSLESRVPFLDYRLIDYVNTLPPAYKFKSGKLKSILIDSFAGLLPKSILERKDKQGFPVPLDIWKNDPIMKDFLASILLSQKAKERGIYNIENIEKEIFNHKGFSRGLWGMLNLELWLQDNE